MIVLFELPTFPEVVSSGPVGIIVASIFFAVFLIIIEQRKERPRKTMMITIASLVGFCSIAAFFLIIKNKSDNEDKYNNLISELNSLAVGHGPFADAYIIDKNGDPKNPKIGVVNADSINLTKALAKRTFRNKKRSFDNYGDSILYIKTDLGTYLGYINLIDLENKIHYGDTKIKSEDLLYASLKRGSIAEHVVEMHLPENIGQAAKYLIKILEKKDEDDQIRTNAGKVLVQRELLNTLDTAQFNVLLDYLDSDERKLPFRYFELAQVYTVLYSQDLLIGKDTLLVKIDSSYKKYIAWYEDPNNTSDPETQTRLDEWYKLSLANID